MDQSECKSLNQLIFDLGSRLGSLEGYLYSEEKVEKNYLPEWLNNINREFDSPCRGKNRHRPGLPRSAEKGSGPAP